MELLEGETLRDILEEGPLPQKQAVDYALQVARGLSAAHEKGVVHRDLKPENVFVIKGGHVKILDFGLAKRVDAIAPGEETQVPTASQHTEPGAVMGTIGYMSPEQVCGLPVDYRSDVFSFGAILYELLSGKRAFKRDTGAETISAILRDEPPGLSTSGRSIPPALDHVVRHCLEKGRDDRFQSVKDIVFALAETANPAMSSGVHVGAPGASKRRTLIVAGVILFLAVGAFLLIKGYFATMASQTKAGPSIAVLPFMNLSEDKSQDYFSDGLSEELMGLLAKVRELHVAGRTSSFAFKGKTEDLVSIGQKLHVGTVLEGSVRRSGDLLRVSAQLVNVADGYQIWAETYDRKLTRNLRSARRDCRRGGVRAEVEAPAPRPPGDVSASNRKYGGVQPLPPGQTILVDPSEHRGLSPGGRRIPEGDRARSELRSGACGARACSGDGSGVWHRNCR